MAIAQPPAFAPLLTYEAYIGEFASQATTMRPYEIIDGERIFMNSPLLLHQRVGSRRLDLRDLIQFSAFLRGIYTIEATVGLANPGNIGGTKAYLVPAGDFANPAGGFNPQAPTFEVDTFAVGCAMSGRKIGIVR